MPPPSPSHTLKHRETLVECPSIQAAVETITSLHAAFKKAHKRNAQVDLFASTVYASNEAPDPAPDRHEVTLSVDLSEVSTQELDWFRAAAKGIKQ